MYSFLQALIEFYFLILHFSLSVFQQSAIVKTYKLDFLHGMRARIHGLTYFYKYQHFTCNLGSTNTSFKMPTCIIFVSYSCHTGVVPAVLWYNFLDIVHVTISNLYTRVFVSLHITYSMYNVHRLNFFDVK